MTKTTALPAACAALALALAAPALAVPAPAANTTVAPDPAFIRNKPHVQVATNPCTIEANVKGLHGKAKKAFESKCHADAKAAKAGAAAPKP